LTAFERCNFKNLSAVLTDRIQNTKLPQPVLNAFRLVGG
jgi:hypothetical protein